MKTILTVLFSIITCGIFAQTFSEKITREFSFEKPGSENALVIANINGSISVTGYDGDKIQVEVTRTIRAKTPARLEEGKKITLGIVDLADTLILYTKGLCSTFGRKTSNKNNWGHLKGWGYDWSGRDSDECQEKAEYKLDYIVRVPTGVNVVVSTVNQGKVSIEQVGGAIVANNVNGGITLSGISREAEVHTVNGNVDITYTKNPLKPCRFYTLNGDINAWFQKGLAAELMFESFNGDLYTNVASLESLPVLVEKESTKNGIRYKVNSNRYKIGSGGVKLDFETFNGNVYLKEKI